MLLLLQAAGLQAPIVDGVRAYATVSYQAAFAGGILMSVVNLTGSSQRATTGASTGATPTTDAADTLGLTTDALPSEE